MKANILEAIGAFSGIYSGWILWNLFFSLYSLSSELLAFSTANRAALLFVVAGLGGLSCLFA